MSTGIPFRCKFTVPEPSAALDDVVSRWSETRVQKPAIVVVPDSEQDIIDATRYAEEKNLCILPAGGGHGSYVTVTPATLYLDMTHFNSIHLNEEDQTVTVGGGVITKQLIDACSDKGYYTCWPNSNAVGVVGFAMGLGNHAFRGLRGMAADLIVSFRIITAGGNVLELSSASTGDELDLFNAIRGAGHGFGVITSLTLKIFPVASLNLQNGDCVWVRKLIFPGSEINTVASLFVNLPEPSPQAMAVAVLARSPPNTPAPGSPLIIISYSYFGPVEDGESAARLLFDKQLTSKTISKETVSVPLRQMNVAFESFNVHGGYKGIHTAWLKRISAKTIEKIYQRWYALTDSDEMSKSQLIIANSNADEAISVGESAQGKASYVQGRDERIAVVTNTFGNTPESSQPLVEYVRELFDICGYEETPWAGVTGVLKDPLMRGQLKLIRREDQLAKLTGIQDIWDPTMLFWSPYFK